MRNLFQENRIRCSIVTRWVVWVGLLCVWTAGHASTTERAPASRSKGTLAIRLIVDGYGRGQPFKVPSGIWFDAHRREIYVADRGNHTIGVFDLDGIPLRHFIHYVTRLSPTGKPVQMRGEPRALAVNSRGDIYVIDDLEASLVLLDYRGRQQRRFTGAELVDPAEPLGANEKVIPSAVAVDKDDQVYVGLSGSRAGIVVLDAEGNVLRHFGRAGKEPGAFSAINGLFVDAQGRIVVTDAIGVSVQCLSPEGEVVLSFGEHDMGPHNFSLPNGAVVDAQGDVWVADAIRQTLRRFDAKGQLQETMGGLGAAPGQMFYPVAVAGDGERLIIVLEKNGARFQIFTRES